MQIRNQLLKKNLKENKNIYHQVHFFMLPLFINGIHINQYRNTTAIHCFIDELIRVQEDIMNIVHINEPMIFSKKII